MPAWLTPAAFLFLALLHLAPAAAAVRPGLIAALYGIAADSPAFTLLQHRAALFAAVCAACLWAAFDPAARSVAAIITAISLLSFLLIYAVNGQPPHLKAIARADLIGLPVLAFALYAAFRTVDSP